MFGTLYDMFREAETEAGDGRGSPRDPAPPLVSGGPALISYYFVPTTATKGGLKTKYFCCFKIVNILCFLEVIFYYKIFL